MDNKGKGNQNFQKKGKRDSSQDEIVRATTARARSTIRELVFLERMYVCDAEIEDTLPCFTKRTTILVTDNRNTRMSKINKGITVEIGQRTTATEIYPRSRQG